MKNVLLLCGTLIVTGLSQAKASGQGILQENTKEIYEAWSITNYDFFMHYFIRMLIFLAGFMVLFIIVKIYQIKYSPFAGIKEDTNIHYADSSRIKKSGIPSDVIGPSSRLNK